MKFYNTLTRKKEEFKPINPKEVSMYSCGPTVYDYVHIGNLRAFIAADLIRRYLKYRGYRIKHVMNITDVDDKTIKNSEKEGKDLNEFTKFYTDVFLDDIKKINIEVPELMPKATDHIIEMERLIHDLEKKGHTYVKNGSVYYKINSFKGYGKIANLEKTQLMDNADGRLDDDYEKEDARDFALWKEEDSEVSWKSRYGSGRPGWHIECSAMSMKYLGKEFDIHTGGVDLVFPHHTNEIAQSEGVTGKQVVHYWMHNNHLVVNGEKMSKSLGNYYALKDLLNKGYSPMAIRYELLSTHYRQKLDFREDRLKDVENTLKKFDELFVRLDNIKSKKDNQKAIRLIENAKKAFEKAMDDDLNISGGLAAIFVFMGEVNKIMDTISRKDAEKVKETMLSFDSVLGVMNYKKTNVPREIKELAEERLAAKNNKDWDSADKLRDKIISKGFLIDDTKKGYIIKKK